MNFANFGASRHENTEKIVEQSGPGYDPQAAVMRWLPLATIATLTPGGSILTRDVRQRKIKLMTPKIYWLFAIALSIACVSSCYAEADPTAEAIKSVAERTVAALQEEDLDAAISTIHSQSPTVLLSKKSLPDLFENYDINTELLSFAYIGQNEDYAVARTKTRYIKASGPFFQNQEVDTITVYRQENGDWKVWNQIHLNSKYLNE